MTKAHARALIVFPSPMFYLEYRRLVDLAAQHRLPAMYVFREAVENSGSRRAWSTSWRRRSRRTIRGPTYPPLKAFLEGLQEMGYVPGQNFLFEVRGPERADRYEQYPDFVAQLVAAGVDVILAGNPSWIEATTRATKTIPIVGVDLESDPVAKG